MIEPQTLNPEILNVTENVTFTPLEWKYFVLELKDMMAEGKFDLPKVIRAARFYAEIERSTEQYKQGKVVTFTEEELEAFDNAQNLHGRRIGGFRQCSEPSLKSLGNNTFIGKTKTKRH